MACPVLRSAKTWTAAFLVIFGGFVIQAASAQAVPCLALHSATVSPTLQKQATELQQKVEAGPFYNEMLRRFGKPKSCELKTDGESIALSFGFRQDAHLDARMDSSIESSEQSAELRGLSQRTALMLLKKAEKDLYGPDGCGIDWGRPQDVPIENQKGSHAAVFRGDSCNCQGRVIYRGVSVVGFRLSSAC